MLHVHLADAAAVPPEAVRDEEREFPGEGVIDLPGCWGKSTGIPALCRLKFLASGGVSRIG